MTDDKRFAVLIDADNVSAKYIKNILDEISNYGIATYKRIYGDWTKSTAASWKDVLLENSVTPVQQYSYTVGKNATDSAMIIDAMDILYSGNVEGFCIVSSDSDFTKLSSRLRESGMLVVGMGEKKTPKPFIAACNQFKYLDVLAASEKKGIEMEETNLPVNENAAEDKNTDAKKTEDGISNNKESKGLLLTESQDIVKNMTDLSVIKNTIIKMMNESEEQSMNMGELGSRLVKRYPDFDVRNYGDTKLSKFLRKFDFLEIKAMGKEGSSMWVSLKTDLNQKEEEVNSSGTKNSVNPHKNRKRKAYRKKKTV
ncbi:NYN domain-containing protein [Anaerocolumna sp. MB42-C2]|uniref:NYN domain-containing protein n=1 Tax=Anaerocolumna sp. MB42-C2 TaxID=3070997 RepID=UPI0027DFD6E4|nr:NYN domain-containing protein [Anaerocolumna sp. MB42-C2]WMJ88661.1 NYN domain-containing protein [Anaerocolumna sp. MB42-C2]